MEVDQHHEDSNSEVVLAAMVNQSSASTPGKTGKPFVRGGEQRSSRSRNQSSTAEQVSAIVAAQG